MLIFSDTKNGKKLECERLHQENSTKGAAFEINPYMVEKDIKDIKTNIAARSSIVVNETLRRSSDARYALVTQN